MLYCSPIPRRLLCEWQRSSDSSQWCFSFQVSAGDGVQEVSSPPAPMDPGPAQWFWTSYRPFGPMTVSSEAMGELQYLFCGKGDSQGRGGLDSPPGATYPGLLSSRQINEARSNLS